MWEPLFRRRGRHPSCRKFRRTPLQVRSFLECMLVHWSTGTGGLGRLGILGQTPPDTTELAELGEGGVGRAQVSLQVVALWKLAASANRGNGSGRGSTVTGQAAPLSTRDTIFAVTTQLSDALSERSRMSVNALVKPLEIQGEWCRTHQLARAEGPAGDCQCRTVLPAEDRRPYQSDEEPPEQWNSPLVDLFDAQLKGTSAAHTSNSTGRGG
ncbi:hypothetical protein SCUP234_02976 [Seiridium cupressi]